MLYVIAKTYYGRKWFGWEINVSPSSPSSYSLYLRDAHQSGDRQELVLGGRPDLFMQPHHCMMQEGLASPLSAFGSLNLASSVHLAFLHRSRVRSLRSLLFGPSPFSSLHAVHMDTFLLSPVNSSVSCWWFDTIWFHLTFIPGFNKVLDSFCISFSAWSRPTMSLLWSSRTSFPGILRHINECNYIQRTALTYLLT